MKLYQVKVDNGNDKGSYWFGTRDAAERRIRTLENLKIPTFRVREYMMATTKSEALERLNDCQQPLYRMDDDYHYEMRLQDIRNEIHRSKEEEERRMEMMLVSRDIHLHEEKEGTNMSLLSAHQSQLEDWFQEALDKGMSEAEAEAYVEQQIEMRGDAS